MSYLGITESSSELVEKAIAQGARLSPYVEVGDDAWLLEHDDPSGLKLRAVVLMSGPEITRLVFLMLGFAVGSSRAAWINEYRIIGEDFLQADLSCQVGSGILVFGVLDTEMWVGRHTLSSDVEVCVGGMVESLDVINQSDITGGFLLTDGVRIAASPASTVWWPLIPEEGQWTIPAGAMYEGPVLGVRFIQSPLVERELRILALEGPDQSPLFVLAEGAGLMDVEADQYIRAFIMLTGTVTRDLNSAAE